MNNGKSIIRHVAKCLLAAIFACSTFAVAAETEIVLDDPLAVTKLTEADSSARLYRLDAGRLVVAHSNALGNARVVVAQGAALRFASSCVLCATNAISGAGTVEVGSGAVVETHARFPGFTGNWVLDGGRVVAGRFVAASLLGLFQFDDATDPYADSSPRNNGLAVGYDVEANGAGSNNPQVVDDAERGKVLYLDGKSWLTGSGANGVQPGFDIGSSPFTLAMWVKTDSNSTIESTYKNGTMFMCGGGGNGKRLTFRFDGSIMKLLYSNWGNDLQFSTTVGTDGGSWVHYAVTHDGAGTIRLYVNGELASTNVGKNGAVPNLAAARLCIGYAINYGSSGDINPFKGYMDDIVFADAVLPIQELMHVGDVLSGEPGDNFADVTNLGGGELDTGTNYAVVANARLAAVDTAEVLRSNVAESWEFETGTGETATTNTFTLNGFSANGSAVPFVTFPFDASRGGRIAQVDGTKQSYLATADENGVAQSYPADYPLGSDPFTLSMWIKTSASDKTGLLWFGNPNWEKYNGISMRMADSNSKILFNYGHNSTIDIGGNGLSDWRHLAITYADAVIKLYVDGELLKTYEQAMDIQVSGANYKLFYLGRYHSSPVYGTVSYDNVRVYRKALSADELALDMSAKSVRCLSSERTLSASPVVTVGSGKVWTVDAVMESIFGLSGAGTVVLTNDAQVTISNDAQFHGRVQGDGDIVLSSGYEFLADTTGAVAPIDCDAVLRLPATAKVAFSCPNRNVVAGKYLLATGNPLIPPSDFSNWTWSDRSGIGSELGGGSISVKYAVAGNQLLMRVATKGCIIIIR